MISKGTLLLSNQRFICHSVTHFGYFWQSNPDVVQRELLKIRDGLLKNYYKVLLKSFILSLQNPSYP